MLPPPTSPPQCNATEPPKRVTTKTHAHVGGRKVVVLRRVMDLDHALERLSLNLTGRAASLNPTQGPESRDVGDVDDSDDSDDNDVTILL
ncbi:hypothetical protein EHS25_006512 [Saitozyma podzolica]|uniref:Uncharacterized protein n=1 Tax=Saitozyma podzolica TaxID=1890683 RepID=A0A427YS20_9TREE|nr:hypothetical protein EHS25_006512 [Saitozyma podzolica]